MKVSEKDEIIQSMTILIKNFENRLDTRLSNIEKEVSQIAEMKNNILKMQKEIVEIKQDIRKISQSVAVIEVEHGNKLKALFDAFSSNRENIERNKKSIEKLKKLYQLHDDKIYSLESKVQGL